MFLDLQCSGIPEHVRMRLQVEASDRRGMAISAEEFCSWAELAATDQSGVII
jgi:hypothetical protein